MQQCTKCILDTTVEDIIFDGNGVCNYCREYDTVIQSIPKGEEAKNVLFQIIDEIKNSGKNKNHDCILGVSGGVDSTYLAYMAVNYGLRPLLVHIDTGWNSEIAVNNIENIINILNLDLYTCVIDWEEMKDLQLSFFKASVPDCDIPQDHVFPAILQKIAQEKNIKHIISGHNIVTEYVLPRNWVYNSNDLTHLLDIHSKFGSVKLKKYPRLSMFKRWTYRYFYNIKSHRFLNLISYDKEQIKAIISEKLNWKDYGGKHFESRFTKFFQSYYLPEKFGFDKRKAHLSNLIISNQITRHEALDELIIPIYHNNDLLEDKEYICKKLDISIDDWEAIMLLPLRKHSDFKKETSTFFYRFYTFIKRL